MTNLVRAALPMVGCALMMAAMMWVLGSGRRRPSGRNDIATVTTPSASRMRALLCIDRRVVISLAVVAAAVLLLAPSAFASFGPLLLIAVCPISMLLMMRDGHPAERPSASAATSARTPE